MHVEIVNSQRSTVVYCQVPKLLMNPDTVPVSNLIVKTVRFYTEHFYVWTNRKKRKYFSLSLLVEIEGHFTNEFESYVYETEDRGRLNSCIAQLFLP
jgi:hypothetical protein